MRNFQDCLPTGMSSAEGRLGAYLYAVSRSSYATRLGANIADEIGCAHLHVSDHITVVPLIAL